MPTGLVREFVEREQAKLDGLLLGSGTEDATALRVRMQEIMTAKVGIFRRGEDLEEAVDELQKLLVRSRNIGLRRTRQGANPELVTAYRTQQDAEARAHASPTARSRAPRAAARTSARTSRAATTRSGSSARSPRGRARATRCRRSTTSRST